MDQDFNPSSNIIQPANKRNLPENEDHYYMLKIRQDKIFKNDIFKKHTLIPVGSTVVVQREDSGLGCMVQ